MTAKALTPGRKKGRKKRQKPNGRESVYSLVRYEFDSSARKSRNGLDWCIFQRVFGCETDNDTR